MDCFCYCKNWPFIHGSAFDTIISWVNRVKLCHIEALIDAAGDRVNFSNQLILDVLQIITVIWSDEIDGKTKVTKAPWKKDARLQYVMLVVVSRSGHNRDHCKHNLFRFWEFIWKKKKKMLILTWSTNAVQVGICTFGEVKIDDNIYCLDVDSPSE